MLCPCIYCLTPYGHVDLSSCLFFSYEKKIYYQLAYGYKTVQQLWLCEKSKDTNFSLVQVSHYKFHITKSGINWVYCTF